MRELTRRRFLAQTSIVGGVAVAGAGALQHLVTPGVSPKAAPNDTLSSILPAALSPAGTLAGPMVVHVRDMATSEIAILVGTQEFVYRDPELVTRLMRTAQQAAIAEG